MLYNELLLQDLSENHMGGFKFTYIVMTKRFDSHFFIEKKFKVEDNIPAAAVIDSVVTDPNKYVVMSYFYFISNKKLFTLHRN